MSRAAVVNYWVQSTAIVVAGVWAFLTYGVGEYDRPQSINLELRIVERGEAIVAGIRKEYLIFSVSASNAGEVAMNLLFTRTNIRALNIDNQLLTSELEGIMDSGRAEIVMFNRSALVGSGAQLLFSMGHFGRYRLQAGETVTETATVYLPPDFAADYLYFRTTAQIVPFCTRHWGVLRTCGKNDDIFFVSGPADKVGCSTKVSQRADGAGICERAYKLDQQGQPRGLSSGYMSAIGLTSAYVSVYVPGRVTIGGVKPSNSQANN